jgi:hypothetical protein
VRGVLEVVDVAEAGEVLNQATRDVADAAGFRGMDYPVNSYCVLLNQDPKAVAARLRRKARKEGDRC